MGIFYLLEIFAEAVTTLQDKLFIVGSYKGGI